jgi:hypothetical protein
MTNILQKIANFILRIKAVYANGGGEQVSFEINNPIGISGNTSLESIIGAITDFLITIGLPLAGLMYLWAGFQFLTAGGDSNKISGAKKTIIYTTIGVAILLTAKGIGIVVQGILTP